MVQLKLHVINFKSLSLRYLSHQFCGIPRLFIHTWCVLEFLSQLVTGIVAKFSLADYAFFVLLELCPSIKLRKVGQLQMHNENEIKCFPL